MQEHRVGEDRVEAFAQLVACDLEQLRVVALLAQHVHECGGAVAAPYLGRIVSSTAKTYHPFPAIGSKGLTHDDNDATLTSIMFGALDRLDPSALHDQVAAQIRRAIAEGDAAPGERLPPAKDLAAVMGVNANTVLRALRVLRDEGLLEFRRGLGIRVAGTAERGAVLARARDLVTFAREQGYQPDELAAIILGMR